MADSRKLFYWDSKAWASKDAAMHLSELWVSHQTGRSSGRTNLNFPFFSRG